MWIRREKIGTAGFWRLDANVWRVKNNITRWVIDEARTHTQHRTTPKVMHDDDSCAVAFYCELSIIACIFRHTTITTNRQTIVKRKIAFLVVRLKSGKYELCLKMVLSANILRTQLVSLTNFSGTHKEHADKYGKDIDANERVHFFIVSFFLSFAFAQISCFAWEHSDKSGEWADRNIEIVYWSE